MYAKCDWCEKTLVQSDTSANRVRAILYSH